MSQKTQSSQYYELVGKRISQSVSSIGHLYKRRDSSVKFSIKESIVAEKSNPLVQANVHWDKHVEGLNLSKTSVIKRHG
jgi:hypothetical protein